MLQAGLERFSGQMQNLFDGMTRRLQPALSVSDMAKEPQSVEDKTAQLSSDEHGTNQQQPCEGAAATAGMGTDDLHTLSGEVAEHQQPERMQDPDTDIPNTVAIGQRTREEVDSIFHATSVQSEGIGPQEHSVVRSALDHAEVQDSRDFQSPTRTMGDRLELSRESARAELPTGTRGNQQVRSLSEGRIQRQYLQGSSHGHTGRLESRTNIVPLERIHDGDVEHTEDFVDLNHFGYEPPRARENMRSNGVQQSNVAGISMEIQDQPVPRQDNADIRQAEHGTQRNQSSLQVDRTVTERTSNISGHPGTQHIVTRKDLYVDKFDGTKERWSVFLTKFERVAKFNGWNEDQKLTVLINCLRGKAADQLDKIPEEKTEDFDYLVGILCKKFDPPGERISQAQALEHRERNTGESISDYADALVTLAKKAYGHLGMDSIKTFAMTRFLAGLPPETRDIVFNKGSKTLDEAVDYVEAYNQYKGNSAESELDRQGKLKRTKLVAAESATDAAENQNTASQYGETLGPSVASVQTEDTMDGGIKKLEQMCEVVTTTMNQGNC
jgi:hypothetical protein